MANPVARDWFVFSGSLFGRTAEVDPRLRKTARRSFYAGYGAAAVQIQQLLEYQDTDTLIAHLKRTSLEMDNFIKAIQEGEA